MLSKTAVAPSLQNLQDLTRLIQRAEGFHPVVAALKNGHGAAVDGAWGSSAPLVDGRPGPARPAHAPGRHRPSRATSTPGPATSQLRGPAPGGLPRLGFPARRGRRGRDRRPAAAPPQAAGKRPTAALCRHHHPGPDPAGARPRQLAWASGASSAVQQQLDLDELAAWLVEHGFKRIEAVELPGEFSRRGGILDVFSPDAEAPYRMEFFGDEIESIRQFSPQTQRSLGELHRRGDDTAGPSIRRRRENQRTRDW